MPYIHLTYPKEKADLGEISVSAFIVSFIFLFGFIPMGVHFLRLDSLEIGVSFCENSTTLLNKYWKHRRSLRQVSKEYTEVTDSVEFESRLPFIGYLLLPVIEFIFQHRHTKILILFNYEVIKMNCGVYIIYDPCIYITSLMNYLFP